MPTQPFHTGMQISTLILVSRHWWAAYLLAQELQSTEPTSLSLSRWHVTDLVLLQKGQLKMVSSERLALGWRLEGVRLLRLPIVSVDCWPASSSWTPGEWRWLSCDYVDFCSR
jgi:hypothetical protein